MSGYAIHTPGGVNDRVYQQYYSDAVTSYLSGRDDPLTVLDIGADQGGPLDRFVQDLRTDLGVEVDAVALEYDRDRLAGYGGDAVRGVGQELPVRDGAVDVAVTNLLLSFLPRDDQTAVLREIDRVLAPDGVAAAEINESGAEGGIAGGRYVFPAEEFSRLREMSEDFGDYPLPTHAVTDLRYDRI